MTHSVVVSDLSLFKGWELREGQVHRAPGEEFSVPGLCDDTELLVGHVDCKGNLVTLGLW